MLAISNPDKVGHHHDQNKDKRFASTLPSHPARLILAGRSGAGKGSTAENILHRATPAFDRIVVYHYDTSTLEWEDCDAEMIDELPENPAKFWDRDKKNLLIIDKVPMDSNKESRNHLDMKLTMLHRTAALACTSCSNHSRVFRVPCGGRRTFGLFGAAWTSIRFGISAALRGKILKSC